MIKTITFTDSSQIIVPKFVGNNLLKITLQKSWEIVRGPRKKLNKISKNVGFTLLKFQKIALNDPPLKFFRNWPEGGHLAC